MWFVIRIFYESYKIHFQYITLFGIKLRISHSIYYVFNFFI